MDVFSTYRQRLILLGFLVLSGILVFAQSRRNEAKHVELRESFILLHSRGYEREAQRLFQKLLSEIQNLSENLLLEDFERTLTLVDPRRPDPENLLWKYHWTVSNELEKRSASSLQRALKLAGDK